MEGGYRVTVPLQPMWLIFFLRLKIALVQSRRKGNWRGFVSESLTSTGGWGLDSNPEVMMTLTPRCQPLCGSSRGGGGDLKCAWAVAVLRPLVPQPFM